LQSDAASMSDTTATVPARVSSGREFTTPAPSRSPIHPSSFTCTGRSACPREASAACNRRRFATTPIAVGAYGCDPIASTGPGPASKNPRTHTSSRMSFGLIDANTPPTSTTAPVSAPCTAARVNAYRRA